MEEGTPQNPRQNESTPHQPDPQGDAVKVTAKTTLSWKDRFTQAKSTMFTMTESLVSPRGAPSRQAVQTQARSTSEGKPGARVFRSSEASNTAVQPAVRVMLLVQERPSQGDSNSVKRDFLAAQKEQFERHFRGEKRVWAEQLGEARTEMAELRTELEAQKAINARVQE
eukprot:407073-Pyramimonas_sp.AAC.1